MKKIIEDNYLGFRLEVEIDSLNNQKIEIFDTDNIDKARKLFEELKKYIRFCEYGSEEEYGN